MLFTTAVFTLLFLPVVLIGFFAAPSAKLAAGWLFLASVFFYGYWMPEFTLLLLGSICGNYFFGSQIARRVKGIGTDRRVDRARAWLVAGIVLNLGLLSYFKYSNFFIENFASAVGAHWNFHHVTLPIGISFFTFTQIAFLVDAYRQRVTDFSFSHYGLFVTYFPHLIAGPILHHSQMMPQFGLRKTYVFDTSSFAVGMAIFALGLIKKVILADGISPYADAIFKPVDAGHIPTLAEAWLGASAYTLQLYFDFSGYSDMAIGLSKMFNIRLPLNFNSPYRAVNISDFWRRWHISLSTFLRDYLYIALGGNRHGEIRRYANLLATMILGGLWHGASWSFVLWGALHGIYLVVNHGFRAMLGESKLRAWDASRIATVLSWALTMLSVIVAWVFFRAETFSGAARMLQGMSGNTPSFAVQPLLWNAGLNLSAGAWWCLSLGALALLPCNSNHIGEQLVEKCSGSVATWSFVGGAASLAVIFLVLISTARDSSSAFIYFNF